MNLVGKVRYYLACMPIKKKKKDKRSDTIGHAHFSLVALNFNI